MCVSVCFVHKYMFYCCFCVCVYYMCMCVCVCNIPMRWVLVQGNSQLSFFEYLLIICAMVMSCHFCSLCSIVAPLRACISKISNLVLILPRAVNKCCAQCTLQLLCKFCKNENYKFLQNLIVFLTFVTTITHMCMNSSISC